MANAVQMGKGYITIGARTGAAMKAIRGLERQVGRFATRIGEIGASMQRVGLAILAPLGLAAINSAKFENRMSAVKAVTSATNEEFARLNNEARKLGRSRTFTAEDVAGGMEALGRAGLKTNQIIKTIPGTLDLARASGRDMAGVAEIMTDVTFGFKRTAEQATETADIIAYTANNSNTNIGLMGEAFQYVAADASKAGQSIQSVAGAMGVLANRSIKGGMAGRQLSMVFARLASDEVQTKLESMGVTVKDGAGNFRDLRDILRDLNRQLEGMGNADQLAIYSDLFGQRGKRAAIILAGLTAEWSRFESRLNSAGGEARRTAGIMEDNLQGAALISWSAVTDLGNETTGALTPSIKNLLATVKGGADDLRIWVKNNKDAVVSIGKLGGAMVGAGVALAAFSITAKGVALVMGGARGLLWAVSAVRSAYYSLNTALAINAFANTAITVTGLTTAMKGLARAAVSVLFSYEKIPAVLASTRAGVAALSAYSAAGGGVVAFFSAFKAGAVAAALAAGPLLVVAAAIAAVGYAAYKAYKYFQDSKYIEEAAKQTEMLRQKTADLNKELRALYRNNPETKQSSLNLVRDRLDLLKKQGKSEAEIRVEAQRRLGIYRKMAAQKWTEDNVLDKVNFYSRAAEYRLMADAYQEYLDKGVSAFRTAEDEKKEIAKQSAAEMVRAQKEALEKQIAIIEDYKKAIQGIQRDRTVMRDREDFTRRMEDNPYEAYKWAQQQLIAARENARNLSAEAQKMMGLEPTSENNAALERATERALEAERERDKFEAWFREAQGNYTNSVRDFWEDIGGGGNDNEKTSRIRSPESFGIGTFSGREAQRMFGDVDPARVQENQLTELQKIVKELKAIRKKPATSTGGTWSN